MVGLAMRAANAGNAQTWRFVAVEDAATRAAMRHAVDAPSTRWPAGRRLAARGKELKALRAYATFFAEAPLVIAVFGLPYGRSPTSCSTRAA